MFLTILILIGKLITVVFYLNSRLEEETLGDKRMDRTKSRVGLDP